MTGLARALGALVLVAPVLGGCATYDMLKAPPAVDKPIAVAVAADGASGWSDLPIGVYRVPNTDVIIAGHQSGGGIGMLFGIVGVVAEDAIETSAGHDKVKDQLAALTIDLKPQAAMLARAAVASGRYGTVFTATPAPDSPVLSITPYTVITYVNDTDVRPYVIVKAELKGGGQKWSTRYIASHGAPLPLSGANSLTADGGAALKAATARDLERAIAVMLDDVANRHPRDGKTMVYVETGFPFLRQRMAITGDKLGEDDATVVFAPKVADAIVFAGIDIIDKAVVTVRPATPDDKAKMLDEGK